MISEKSGIITIFVYNDGSFEAPGQSFVVLGNEIFIPWKKEGKMMTGSTKIPVDFAVRCNAILLQHRECDLSKSYVQIDSV